jgi:DNA-binding NarL/FixJ family response regulator
MAASCPEARAVMFSGHVRIDLIERAFAAGAWGYVSKIDGETALINAVRAVRNGEIALSAEARSLYGEP